MALGGPKSNHNVGWAERAMAFNVTRRQVFSVKGKKKKPPRPNWMKQAREQRQSQGGKEDPSAVFGGRGYVRPVPKSSLARRLTKWSVSLALLAGVVWGTVLIAKAVLSKLDQQPTIAQQIANSRTWRGQSAEGAAAPGIGAVERGHVTSTEESFIAAHPQRKSRAQDEAQPATPSKP